ncbi:xanthine dehydrogenase-like isoform X1 [Euwallacea similis]|uniref:xanthine dehydrogenase-like isoform X1 n=1 Tax=Euwallacea similis TaxID=1736056 RepID=UPI003450B441
MNMYALKESGPKTKLQIENSFGGNICRCTGYRPIMEAFYTLASNPVDIEETYSIVETCPKTSLNKTAPLRLKLSKGEWMKVYYLRDLMGLLRTSGHVSYMLVAGNTAKGVFWLTSYPKLYICISDIDELNEVKVSEDSLILGACVSLTRTMEVFRQASKDYPKFKHLEQAANHIDLIANVPVRNIGSLGGNLMIKHQHPRFQSDVFLILETMGASLIIIDIDGNELMKSPKEFLDIDMNKKVIKQIIVPGLDPKKYYFGSYKIMNRAQNTHAVVNAGFLFALSSRGVVNSASIVYGAINTAFEHASNTEALLKGLTLFDNKTLQKAFSSLDQELVPDIEPPDPSPECRKLLAINLFYKYVLSIAPKSKVSPKNQSGGSLLSRGLSSGTQEFTTDKAEYPVTEPIVKLEALAQTSGQAQYVMDKPDLPNQLHGSLVLIEAPPGSIVTSINPSKALQEEGVVAFYSAKDIPGVNSMIAFGLGPQELFCSDKVQFHSQPIGVIIANTHEIANYASKLVEIEVEKSKEKPLLRAKEVVEAHRKDKIEHKTAMIPKRTGKETSKIKGEFYLGLQYHYFMETHSCYVVPHEGGLEVWATTQFMAGTQFAVAQVVNMDAQNIDVTVKRVGGGYGGKVFNINYSTAAAALAAVKLQKPVRVWMPFHTTMSSTGKRYPFYAKYEVGVDSKGVIQNMTSDLYSDCGMINGDLGLDSFVRDCFENCYKTDTWAYDTYVCKTDTHPNTYTRAPGTLEGLACIESIMEEIAYSLNLDPLEVRLANLDGDKHPKLKEFVKELRIQDKLEERTAAVRKYNEANRWKKKGLSVVLMKWTLSVMGSYSVLVSIFTHNGGVAICHGGTEVGQGINTKVAQVCAQKLGIPMSLVSIKPSVTFVSPNNFATAGSWTSEVVCHVFFKLLSKTFCLIKSFVLQSVILACDELLKRIEPIRKKHPDAPWAELVKLCYFNNINLSCYGYTYNDNKEIKDYLIYGVCASEVVVDILTGQKVISRVDIIEDLGQSMNPLIDMGQVEGAFIMGLGYHLLEDIIFDPEGRVLNNRTWNYTPPGVKDIPVDFRVRFPSNNPNPIGILKSKACSEPPVCLAVAVPLAIRNALASARSDADSHKNKWVPFNGPTTVEYTLLNSLNDYSQYTL